MNTENKPNPKGGILVTTKERIVNFFNRMIKDDDGKVSTTKCMTLGGVVMLLIIVPTVMIEVIKFIATCVVIWWLFKLFGKKEDVQLVQNAEVLS